MTDTSKLFSNYLQTNEVLKWNGRPPVGLLFRKSDIFMIPFTLLWGGFAIFWTLNAVLIGAPLFFHIVGSFFTLMGLYMIIGRFIFDIIKRKYTFYGITNERAIIIFTFLGLSIKSFELKSIKEISINLKSNGKGTIIFGDNSEIQSFIWNDVGQGRPYFELIDNANQVYNMIRGIKNA